MEKTEQGHTQRCVLYRQGLHRMPGMRNVRSGSEQSLRQLRKNVWISRMWFRSRSIKFIRIPKSTKKSEKEKSRRKEPAFTI